jgi:hypothetical protein
MIELVSVTSAVKIGASIASPFDVIGRRVWAVVKSLAVGSDPGGDHVVINK